MAAALIAGAMALQAWDGLQQAESIRRSSAMQQRIDEMNAKYAEIDAYEAEKYGYTQVARYQTTIDQTSSEQKSILAAKNVDINFGTAAEVQADTKVAGMLNSVDLMNQARKRAFGLRTQASNLRLQGAMGGMQAEINAQGAQRHGLVSAGVTGLSMYTRGGNYKDGTETPSSSDGSSDASLE